MGKIIATTFVTADKYQHYLPMYIYSLKRSYPQILVKTFIQGRIDSLNTKAFNYLHDQGLFFDLPIENLFKDIKLRKSTANALRFLIPEQYFRSFDYLFITDADLLIFQTQPSMADWHIKRMISIGSCFAGHHGPWKRKYRPEVNTAGWKGDFERVSGGFFMATPKWFKKTKKARKKYRKLIENGKYDDTYREADEVMIGRILKESKLPIPKMRKVENFNIDIRGIHYGDFKGTMKKRYKSPRKMRKVVTKWSCKEYLELLKDPIYQGLMDIMQEDHKLAKIFPLVENYCRRRVKK